MLCDFSLCSDEYDIFKTCEILAWLKNCTYIIQQGRSIYRIALHTRMHRAVKTGCERASLLCVNCCKCTVEIARGRATTRFGTDKLNVNNILVAFRHPCIQVNDAN